MNILRPVALGILSAFALAAGSALAAPPAQAHADLVTAYPAPGASMAVSPDELTLTFTDPLPEPDAEISVTDQAGTDIAIDPVEVVGTSVTRHLAEDAPPGRYTVAWAVTAADGHRESGEYEYVLAAAATPTPGTTPTTPDETGESADTGSERAAMPSEADDTRTIWILYATSAALIFAAIVGVVMGFRESRRRMRGRR